MYCASCGAELRPDARFCWRCGAPVPAEGRGPDAPVQVPPAEIPAEAVLLLPAGYVRAPARRTKAGRRLRIAGILALAALLVLAVTVSAARELRAARKDRTDLALPGFQTGDGRIELPDGQDAAPASAPRVPMSIPNRGPAGADGFNIANYGTAAMDADGAIYFRGAFGALYKTLDEGETVVQLTAADARCINVSDGWVYFIGSPDGGADARIGKIPADGGEVTWLGNCRADDFLIAVDDVLFWIDADRAIRVAYTDGSGCRVLHPGNDLAYSWLAYRDGSLYAVMENAGASLLVRVPLDSMKDVYVLRAAVTELTCMSITGDVLTFWDRDDDLVYAMDLDTGETRAVFDNAAGYWIFGVDGDELVFQAYSGTGAVLGRAPLAGEPQDKEPEWFFTSAVRIFGLCRAADYYFAVDGSHEAFVLSRDGDLGGYFTR